MQKAEIKSLISLLGYKPQDGKNDIYYKKYSLHNDYTIKINFQNEKIEYRDEKISEENGISWGDATTSNFEGSENFVVLECVDRLLEKGYSPKSIFLEYKYPLGRQLKGKLDILVFDKEKSPFIMIECKTWGIEYQKELKKMVRDGGQLFSYYVQDKATKYLCLYTSHIDENKIEYRNEIVRVDEAWLELNNKKEIHDHWNKNFKDNGIFEEWTNPYDVEIKALVRGRLKELTQEDSGKIFNQFAEILRHNIVSDKPNAFNKILNLFICKIYDENKNDDEEVEFQWLEDDTDETLQYRLNDLYKKGMLEFLGIEVTDYSEEDISSKLINIEDKNVLEDVKEMFLKLRLQKNSEFAFIEVYNDQSFKSNARVVHEVVELLQPYQFRYGHKQQFLGDFFELLLNTSIKQESGQFFTPVPITRFIVSCLPIKEFIIEKMKSNETQILPTAIDYATGSGHFLTEYMDQVQTIIENIDVSKAKPSARNNVNIWKSEYGKFQWAKEYVYGIEADYRLVKTAKVSSFLNGDGEAIIIRADGLDNFSKSKDFKLKLKEVSKDNQKDNGQFDILIANPPYSVNSFKTNLQFGEESFELYNKLTDNSSEIECLFIERAKQLLKIGGWTGIILPSSILSNTGIYTVTREIILKYFKINGIAEFGSNTFMATGTNTVTLFLERRNNNDWEIIYNAIKNFFEIPKDVTVLGIERAFSKYVNEIFEDITFEDYVSLVSRKPNDRIKKKEIYQDYVEWFKNLTEVKQMKNKKAFKELGKDEQQAQLDKLFFDKIFEIEKDKMLYFMLIYSQKTTIIKVGEKQAEKKFIGYEFSKRRGNEGIKMLPNETKLYDEENPLNPQKANTYIYNSFLNKDIKVDETMEKNVFILDTIHLIDFSKINFEKAININTKKKLNFKTRWESEKLGVLCNIKIGGTPSRNNNDYYKNGTHNWLSISEMDGNIIYDTKEKITDLGVEKSNVKLIKRGTTLISFKLSIGKMAIAGVDLYTNEAIAALEITDKYIIKVSNKYLFNLFTARLIDLSAIDYKAFGKSLNSTFLKELVIPLPPIKIQNKIVSEIEVVEKNEFNIKNIITKLKNEIINLVKVEKDSETKGIELRKVAIINPSKGELRSMNDDTEISFVQMASLSEDGYIENKETRRLDTVINQGYTCFRDGDIIIAKITPCMENGKCAIATNLTNGIGFGSTEFHVIRPNTQKALSKYIFLMLNCESVREQAKLHMTGKSGHRRVPQSFYKDFVIQNVSIEQQKIFISKIEAIEAEIQKLEAEIADTEDRKKDIIIKYLQ